MKRHLVTLVAGFACLVGVAQMHAADFEVDQVHVRAVASSSNVQPSASKGAPSEAEMKKIWEKGIWGPNYKETKTYKYPFLRVLPAKQVGSTVYFPVFVECHVTTHFPDGVSRTQRKHHLFEFYKDEYGFWNCYDIRHLEGHDDILSEVKR